MQETKNNSFKYSIALVTVIAVIAVYLVTSQSQAPISDTTGSTSTGDTSGTGTTPTTIVEAYKDGTYSSVGSYVSPAGGEQVGVTITLKDGVIADATFQPKATFPESREFQNIFAANYKPFVIGKKIADLKLTKVSGSSLTPRGFNDAIEKIKTEAGA